MASPLQKPIMTCIGTTPRNVQPMPRRRADKQREDPPKVSKSATNVAAPHSIDWAVLQRHGTWHSRGKFGEQKSAERRASIRIRNGRQNMQQACTKYDRTTPPHGDVRNKSYDPDRPIAQKDAKTMPPTKDRANSQGEVEPKRPKFDRDLAMLARSSPKFAKVHLKLDCVRPPELECAERGPRPLLRNNCHVHNKRPLCKVLRRVLRVVFRDPVGILGARLEHHCIHVLCRPVYSRRGAHQHPSISTRCAEPHAKMVLGARFQHVRATSQVLPGSWGAIRRALCERCSANDARRRSILSVVA